VTSDTSRTARAMRWAIGLVAAGVLVYAMAYFPTRPVLVPTSERSSTAKHEMTSKVSAADRRDHRYEVAVPDATPTSFISAETHTVKQGDVIEIAVISSHRPGAVAVHGFFEPQPLASDGSLVVAFRVIYSGRFALHFHGADGSHFELMVLNVMPSDAADSR
jgi:hypothetical protein